MARRASAMLVALSALSLLTCDPTPDYPPVQQPVIDTILDEATLHTTGTEQTLELAYNQTEERRRVGIGPRVPVDGRAGIDRGRISVGHAATHGAVGQDRGEIALGQAGVWRRAARGRAPDADGTAGGRAGAGVAALVVWSSNRNDRTPTSPADRSGSCQGSGFRSNRSPCR